MYISNVSARAILIALRWCSINGFPQDLSTWTEKQNLLLNIVAQEWDNRQSRSI